MSGIFGKSGATAVIGLAVAALAMSDVRPAPAQEGGAVEMVFLGNMGFKFTSPDGLVIFTDPWLEGNPDAPMAVADVEEADLILVSGGHGDNVGSAIELAKTTGATVIATAELAAWLGAQGVPKEQLYAMMPGGLYRQDGVSVKVLQAVHTAGFWPPEQATPGYAGASIGFLITFENDLRVYFSGDTTLFGDMRLFGELYKPQVAILSTRGRYMMEPADGALAAQFLMTENPELKTVVPAHHLLNAGDPEVAATPDRVEAEVEKLGLPVSVLKAVPGETYTLAK